MHFIFRRLHSQQLRVPFRIFLRFAPERLSSESVDTARSKDMAFMEHTFQSEQRIQSEQSVEGVHN
jgi:hypothetical protein